VIVREVASTRDEILSLEVELMDDEETAAPACVAPPNAMEKVGMVSMAICAVLVIESVRVLATTPSSTPIALKGIINPIINVMHNASEFFFMVLKLKVLKSEEFIFQPSCLFINVFLYFLYKDISICKHKSVTVNKYRPFADFTFKKTDLSYRHYIP